MTVLVTGGAGFIGSHLVDTLLKDKKEVICLDDFNDYYAPARKRKNISHNIGNKLFTLVEGDIRNKPLVRRIFKEHKIEKVAHLAARAGVRSSLQNPQLYYDVNVDGTTNLLEACKDSGVMNFVFGSSSSVYGVNKKVPFSESDPIENMISPYAISKRAGEFLCYNYNKMYKLPTICLRFFTVYGPRGRPDMAIYKFTKAIDEGKPIEMYGEGTTKRDYTFVSDIVDGIKLALDKKFDFEIFNLADNNPVELRYLISLIEKNVGKKAKIIQKEEQPGDVPITYADISRAEKMLGYHPKVKIEEGIRRFVEWYKQEC
jgi:UDP-glucuronate 4-epimerase